ncbi:hypothetical protein [Azospirillum argentinense]
MLVLRQLQGTSSLFPQLPAGTTPLVGTLTIRGRHWQYLGSLPTMAVSFGAWW